jgi:hypothetical protein
LLLSFLQQFLHVDQNAKIVEENKAAKCKVAEAKEKVRFHKVLSFLFLKYMVQLQIVCCFYCCVHVIYMKEVSSNIFKKRWKKLLCQMGLASQF